MQPLVVLRLCSGVNCLGIHLKNFETISSNFLCLFYFKIKFYCSNVSNYTVCFPGRGACLTVSVPLSNFSTHLDTLERAEQLLPCTLRILQWISEKFTPFSFKIRITGTTHFFSGATLKSRLSVWFQILNNQFSLILTRCQRIFD